MKIYKATVRIGMKNAKAEYLFDSFAAAERRMKKLSAKFADRGIYFAAWICEMETNAEGEFKVSRLMTPDYITADV
ncbi:MAG: hypothetical protein K2H21_05325 [Muribaculaceae bacterium]|nr:hypothetical protein [Muribaculaceae bacterium]